MVLRTEWVLAARDLKSVTEIRSLSPGQSPGSVIVTSSVVPATAGSLGELGSEKAREEIQIAINTCCLVIQE